MHDSMKERIHRDWLASIEYLIFVPAMTPAQYRTAIAKLGLSQERAGLWLGIGKRTSQGYALGERPVPEPVAKLLRLMVSLKLDPKDVA